MWQAKTTANTIPQTAFGNESMVQVGIVQYIFQWLFVQRLIKGLVDDFYVSSTFVGCCMYVDAIDELKLIVYLSYRVLVQANHVDLCSFGLSVWMLQTTVVH